MDRWTYPSLILCFMRLDTVDGGDSAPRFPILPGIDPRPHLTFLFHHSFILAGIENARVKRLVQIDTVYLRFAHWMEDSNRHSGSQAGQPHNSSYWIQAGNRTAECWWSLSHLRDSRLYDFEIIGLVRRNLGSMWIPYGHGVRRKPASSSFFMATENMKLCVPTSQMLASNCSILSGRE